MSYRRQRLIFHPLAGRDGRDSWQLSRHDRGHGQNMTEDKSDSVEVTMTSSQRWTEVGLIAELPDTFSTYFCS